MIDCAYCQLLDAAIAKRGRHEQWATLETEVDREKTDGRHLRPDA